MIGETMTDRKLCIGFIGNGKSTNRYHLPFILERYETMWVKKIQASARSLKNWKQIEGIEYTEQIEDILSDEDIDVVVVATPAATHYDYAVQAILAGKHCIVEKPFTDTLEEAEKLFTLAEKKGVILQCYQNRRFDSDFLTTQQVIESGKLGDVFEVELHFDYYRPEVPESTTSYNPSHSFVYGHASHTLDQAISFFGIPGSVNYDVRQLLGEGRANDYFDFDLYYDNALKVSIKSSYFRAKARPSFVAYGTRGVFVKETKDKQEEDLKKFYMPSNPDFGLDSPSDFGTLTYYDEGTFHEEKVVSVKGDYGYYYDALVKTILHGEKQLVTPVQTLEVMRIMEDSIKHLK